MFEPLNHRISVCVSKEHTFGTDALLLAGAAFEWSKDAKTVCDLGTGCGIVPLTLCALGMDAHITGLDIQKEAIDQFAKAIEHCGVTNCTPIAGDLTQKETLPSGVFDLVTCNPPYFRVGHGPLPPQHHRALARYEIACTVQDICTTARRITKPQGKLIVCYPPNRLAHVLSAMEDAGFKPRILRFVQQDGASAPWLFTLMGQKGAGDDLKILPPVLRKPNDPYKEVLPL